MNHGRCSHCRQPLLHRIEAASAAPLPVLPRPVGRRAAPAARRPAGSAARLHADAKRHGRFVEPNRAASASIVDLIAERRQRLYSRERDVGLRWRDGETIYRAAWIEDTRELYLVQLGTPDRGGGHVELLAAGLEFEELEEAVCGWREAQDNGHDSLDWLRGRVRRLRANGRALVAG